MQNALLEAILESKNSSVIFCYAENNEKLESLALSISKEKQNENSLEITIDISQNKNSNSFEEMINFLNNENKTFTTNLYTLKRG